MIIQFHGILHIIRVTKPIVSTEYLHLCVYFSPAQKWKQPNKRKSVSSVSKLHHLLDHFIVILEKMFTFSVFILEFMIISHKIIYWWIFNGWIVQLATIWASRSTNRLAISLLVVFSLICFSYRFGIHGFPLKSNRFNLVSIAIVQ